MTKDNKTFQSGDALRYKAPLSVMVSFKYFQIKNLDKGVSRAICKLRGTTTDKKGKGMGGTQDSE
jgi:hypothetical protein